MPDVCSSLLFVENREQNRIEPSRKWSDLRAVCVATGTRRMGRKGASLVELTEKKKPTENSRLWGIGGGYGTSNSLKNSWLISCYPRHYPQVFYLKYKADARSVEFAVNPK